MRWSELVGLRRRSVDAARRKIRVVEQLVQLHDGSWIRRPPKTDSGTRTVAVAVAVVIAEAGLRSMECGVGEIAAADLDEDLGRCPVTCSASQKYSASDRYWVTWRGAR